jgi:predicted 3-demethylubiquinone-9 3-methyltransferase (glyoxalase superfamily)
MVTDGPYAETKELLAGLLILEANDINAAIELMSNHPGVRLWPCEIRPADEQFNALVADRGKRVERPEERIGNPPSQTPFHRGNYMAPKRKNTICVWYDRDAEEAARFYAQTFPDSAIGAVHRAPGDYPSGKKGDVLMVEFTVMGVPCLGLNGGPAIKHNEAFSFQVATEDQAETDRYWNAIVGNGGQESACGWCKDKWGVSWQITPRALTEAVMGSDAAAAKRAFDAMMTMKKIDVAAIEAARRG